MRPTCYANKTADFKDHICSLPHGHLANHRDTRTGYSWPRPGMERATWTHTPVKREDSIVLELTLEELKGLVYALSGKEWREDEPELVAKVEKALKDAL